MPQPARNLIKPKPRPKPRARAGKPSVVHEGVENPNNLPMLRTSERKDFKRCPQRWQWGWREGLKPYGPPNDKLWFGTGWHMVMAHWYGLPGTKRGKDPIKFWREWVGDEITKIRVNLTGDDDWKEEVYLDAGKLGEEMIANYLDKYGTDPYMRMIQVEKPFEVIIADANGVQRVLFMGTYDGVYQDLRDGTYWLLEHKTAKAIQTNHLELDDQGGGYLTVAARELADAGLIPAGKQIKGILYNFVRKAPKDPRPVNEQGLATNLPKKEHYVAQLRVSPTLTLSAMQELAEKRGVTVLGEPSKTQPTPLFHREPVTRTVRERNGILLGMQAEVQHMEAMRTGALPLYKNPTKDCSWDCNFYQMCVLHGSGGPAWEEYKRSVYHAEDPYADHRKSAADLESF